MSQDIAEIKRVRIEWGGEKKKCPCCGLNINPGTGVGSGSWADGIFCSLDCYTRFHLQDMRGCSCIASD